MVTGIFEPAAGLAHRIGNLRRDNGTLQLRHQRDPMRFAFFGVPVEQGSGHPPRIARIACGHGAQT